MSASMSLTSQIKDKNSPVRQFFTKFENEEGRKECLAQLQSTKPIRQPPFTPASAVVYAFAGTTADYLIRYAASGNSLSFENTIAHQALKYAKAGLITDSKHLADLYDIGKQYLDGRDASDPKAVYSATALAMLDNVLRSGVAGRLPELFDYLNHKYRQNQIAQLGLRDLINKTVSPHIRRKQKLRWIDPEVKARLWLDKGQMEKLGLEIPEGEKTRFLVDVDQVKKSLWDKIKDRPTRFLFDAYLETLDGELYTQDVSELIKTFVGAIKSRDSELFNAQLIVSNQALGNSWLVGGADFDCVIEYNNRLILTDIKTTTKRLATEHFRQILGYALLYDEKEDDFKFTDIGIYHSRSGSFRFLSMDSVIEKSLPGFKSVSLARKEFISELKKI